jgi:membrane protein YdbS with pleckstrin-like domain
MVPLVKPELRQHFLPMGLLVAAIVCGAISWTVEGTVFWVMAGASLVLIVAGIVAAMRVDAARRKRQ